MGSKTRKVQRTELEGFFHPKSVAVVGASRDPAKLGHVLLKNVLDCGFPGEVYPVNPSGGKLLKRKVYASLLELPEAPDLVLLSIPNRAVPGAIREAAARQAKAAVVLSSGFGEMGGEGAQLQEEVRRSGLRVLGPNCMGLYHLPSRLNGTYFWEIPKREGGLAFVSQSGAYGGMLFSQLRQRALGLSTFVSIGNQTDVTHVDVLEHLAGDEATQVVALFIEELRDGRRFLEACQRVACRKRVVAMKVGRTPAGRRAALSHTGSMAGDFEVCRAALRQAGVFVAQDTAEFFDVLATFSAYPDARERKERQKGLGIVTISGGPCVAAADACEELGVAVPELRPATQARIRELIPEFGATRNPVDMTPQMNPANMPDCIAAVTQDPGIEALMAINVGLDRPEFAEAFIRARDRVPVLSFLVDDPVITERFSEAGIPIFETPERAVRAYAALAPGTLSPMRQAGARLSGGRVLDEYESKRTLGRAGLAVCRESRSSSLPQAVKAARRLGYPVVLKALGAGAHKSDRGGIILNLANEEQLRAAFRKLARRFGKPVLVQELVRGDHEVLVGARRDSTFGPVVLFGSGGLWTEQLRDVAIRVCPLTQQEALAMILETSAGARLRGARGTRRGDMAALTGMLVALSEWMLKTRNVLEVDLNPVITGGPRTVAVDALVIRQKRDRPCPERAKQVEG